MKTLLHALLAFCAIAAVSALWYQVTQPAAPPAGRYLAHWSSGVLFITDTAVGDVWVAALPGTNRFRVFSSARPYATPKELNTRVPTDNDIPTAALLDLIKRGVDPNATKP